MRSPLSLLLLIAVVVALAKLAGYASVRLRQPAVLGELIVGLLLGPSLLDALHRGPLASPEAELVLEELAQLGVLLLMFIAGLEIEFEAMLRYSRISLLAGTLGVLAPVVLGALVASLFGFALKLAIFVGIVLAATSVSISAQTLMELGALRTRLGVALLGAAVVDDVLVILALSVFTALAGGSGHGAWSVFLTVLRMLAFFALAYAIGARFLGRIGRQVERLPVSEALAAYTLVVILLFSWAAEALGGVASITGAFLAGLLLSRTPLRDEIEERIHGLAYSWLVPIFFVNIGLQANIRQLQGGGIPFALAVVAVALLSKVLGCGSGARLGGCTLPESLQLGVGMISRGEVGLIVASIGLSTGLVGQEVFAAVVLTVLATTLLTPAALRALNPQRAPEPTPIPQPENGS